MGDKIEIQLQFIELNWIATSRLFKLFNIFNLGDTFKGRFIFFFDFPVGEDSFIT